jgi:hypothetical protein
MLVFSVVAGWQYALGVFAFDGNSFTWVESQFSIMALSYPEIQTSTGEDLD